MTEPTGDEIARWTALAEQATPGPWGFGGRGVAATDRVIAVTDVASTQAMKDAEPGWGWVMQRDAANGAFIAEARTAVPRLLALVAAQAEPTAELRDRLVALAADRDQADYVLRATGDKLEAIREQRDQAEAKIARVRALCDRLAGDFDPAVANAAELFRDALDGTGATDQSVWKHNVVAVTPEMGQFIEEAAEWDGPPVFATLDDGTGATS